MIGLTYSISDVHTHAYYAERAAALADCPDMDRLYLKDPGGLLTPDAVRELAPHFVAAAGERPLELHSHFTIGLAPLVYVEGLQAGFQVLHTAVGPLARGTSQPGSRDDAPQPRGRGLLAPARPRRAGRRCPSTSARSRRGGLPLGAPRSTTPPTTTTSSPAGWCPTTRRMLEELRRPELFDAVLEEVGRVRAEMGYPIIVTPVSQFVATQAVVNVIDGERWTNVSDETVRYFLGHYGDRRLPSTPTSPSGCSRCRASRSSPRSSRSISRVRASASARGSPTRSCCCG